MPSTGIQLLQMVGATVAVSLIYLFFTFVVRRGGYPTVEPLKLRLVHLEVAALFSMAFLTNATWHYFSSTGSPQPQTTILRYGLVTVQFLPILSQVLIRRRSFREIGLAPIKNYRAVLILVVWLGLFLVGSLGYRSLTGTLSLPLLPQAPLMIVGLLSEELFFRGFVQTRLETTWGIERAWIGSSLLWGATHVGNYLFTGTYVGLLSVIQIVFLGMLWGVCFGKTRSIFVTWPVHVVYDLFVAVPLGFA